MATWTSSRSSLRRSSSDLPDLGSSRRIRRKKSPTQVGELAADLSVTDVRATSGGSLRRTGRQASAARRLPHAHRTPRPISYRHARAAQLGDGLNSSLTFCWRGLRIMGGDIAESAGSCKRWFKARPAHTTPPIDYLLLPAAHSFPGAEDSAGGEGAPTPYARRYHRPRAVFNHHDHPPLAARPRLRIQRAQPVRYQPRWRRDAESSERG